MSENTEIEPGEYLTNVLKGKRRDELRDQVKSLTEKNNILSINLQKREEDNNLLFSHLTKQLDNCNEQITQLEKDKLDLRNEIIKTSDSKDEEIQNIRLSHYAECDEFHITISNLKNELKLLGDFKENKIRLEKEMVDVKNALEKEKRERKLEVDGLTNELVDQRRSMMQDMAKKLQDQKEELMSLQYSNLTVTTKKALYELEEKTGIIQLMTSQIHNLAEKNKFLDNENKSMKSKLSMLKDNEVLLCKKNKELSSKVSRKSIPPPSPPSLSTNNSETDLSESKYIKEIDTLNHKLRKLKIQQKERDALLDSTALFIMLCLQDIRSSFISYKAPPAAISDLSREEREHFLNIIMERLRQNRQEMIEHSGYGGLAPVPLKQISLAEALHALEMEIENPTQSKPVTLPMISSKSLPSSKTLKKPQIPAPASHFKRWSKYYR